MKRVKTKEIKAWDQNDVYNNRVIAVKMTCIYKLYETKTW